MNNFRKVEKITIRWIPLSTFRTTGPEEYCPAILIRVHAPECLECPVIYYAYVVPHLPRQKYFFLQECDYERKNISFYKNVITNVCCHRIIGS